MEKFACQVWQAVIASGSSWTDLPQPGRMWDGEGELWGHEAERHCSCDWTKCHRLCYSVAVEVQLFTISASTSDSHPLVQECLKLPQLQHCCRLAASVDEKQSGLFSIDSSAEVGARFVAEFDLNAILDGDEQARNAIDAAHTQT